MRTINKFAVLGFVSVAGGFAARFLRRKWAARARRKVLEAAKHAARKLPHHHKPRKERRIARHLTKAAAT